MQFHLVLVILAIIVLDKVNSSLIPLYRYWNGVDHFYTTDVNEIGTSVVGATGKYGYQSEGVAGYVNSVASDGLLPLYRYWNGRDHFYTTDVNEIGTNVPGVTGKYGYKSEGVAGYVNSVASDGLLPLYRYWNGVEHFYTTDVNEIGTNVPGVTGKYGYKSEGVAGYVSSVTKNVIDDEFLPLYRYWNGVDHFYTTDVSEIGTNVPGVTGKYGYQSEGVAGYVSTVIKEGLLPLYRYWNGRDHFYTTDVNEIGTNIPGVTGKYGYQSEGVAGYVNSVASDGLLPLYRYWNGVEHFYTTDVNEIGTNIPGVTGKYGYKSEGVAGYVYSSSLAPRQSILKSAIFSSQ